ncbi:MAG TPA: alpha/beta hydrolase [Flavobacteriaceae bacterium]|nr:alpha/beta hydrolase [Flavobacteriaceae bacterium]
MNIKKLPFIFIFLLCFIGLAQEVNYSSEDISINNFVDGTLLTPNSKKKPILAILIAGSGPTDRNGNQNFLKNNALKKLAKSLSNHGIATFRYDKRVVKQIVTGNIDKNTTFDDFVTDATSVIEYFKETNAYSKIYVIGHGQGSLVGMLAGKGRIDGFVSLAGAGQSIDKVIIEQVQKTAPQYTEDAKRVFGIMRSGKTTSDYPPVLYSLFNIEIQPFMMNWMEYDPKEVIKSLNVPILIINGTKDLRVSVEESKMLKEAAPEADLKIIDKMNHVLFIIEGDNLDNAKSYNESARNISQELVSDILEFIK